MIEIYKMKNNLNPPIMYNMFERSFYYKFYKDGSPPLSRIYNIQFQNYKERPVASVLCSKLCITSSLRLLQK